jgi:hypothetical protein
MQEELRLMPALLTHGRNAAHSNSHPSPEADEKNSTRFPKTSGHNGSVTYYDPIRAARLEDEFGDRRTMTASRSSRLAATVHVENSLMLNQTSPARTVGPATWYVSTNK